MSRELPILFNTEMVRAILDGRKSCTRRLVKPQPDEKHTFPLGFVTDSTEKKEVGCFGFGIDEYGGSVQYAKPPYQSRDILYVRETFAWCPCWDCGLNVEEPGCEYEQEKKYNNKKKEHGCYVYRASCEDNEYPSADTWHPSIHMPKEAARIWTKDILYVSHRLGHANTAVTAKYYVCDDIEADRKMANVA